MRGFRFLSSQKVYLFGYPRGFPLGFGLLNISHAACEKRISGTQGNIQATYIFNL